MRQIPDDLAARIESGAANLAYAWILTRTDDVRLGFTDHDRDLIVDGVTCKAASGWTNGVADGELGFTAGTAAAAGALDDDAITEADIARGAYDGATVELWRVDWSAPSLCVRLGRGTIRRIKREGASFTAEVEGPLAALERVAGRTYGKLCDAALGDARCRADVSGDAFNGSGAVTAVQSSRQIVVSGLDDFATGWFARGRLVWSSGANAGRAMTVAGHDVGAAGVVITLESEPLAAVAEGDEFSIRAGCDKRWPTCGTKFSNSVNYQGFPTIPGDDFLTAYASGSGVNDGGRR